MRNLPPGSATARAEAGDLADWSLLASNVADLVDLMTFWLTAEYVKWTTDPDDPEVKAEQKRRKAAGIKPPPIPLVQPVAHRPPSLAAQYERRFVELAEEFRTTAPAGPAARDEQGSKRWVSSDEFDILLGI